MDAILIHTIEGTDGAEYDVREAKSVLDTWPGYHQSSPLGRAGFWAGTHASHSHHPDKESLIEWADAITHGDHSLAEELTMKGY